MVAILEIPKYVAYLKNIAYGFIKLSAKSHSFNILCTMDVFSCPTTGYLAVSNRRTYILNNTMCSDYALWWMFRSILVSNDISEYERLFE